MVLKLFNMHIVSLGMGVRQNRPKMKEKVFGSNNVRPHNDYASLSIPPQVLDDDEFNIGVGTEVAFVGRVDEDGKRLVLEIVEE